MAEPRRRCEGIIIERGTHRPYWKRCTAFAVHGDYCTQCFQKREQNDSARACLVPGWEEIIKGDESRRGKGKPRVALEGEDKLAARQLREQRRVERGSPPPPMVPTEPVLLDRRTKAPETAPEPPDDIFSAARKALAAMTKI